MELRILRNKLSLDPMDVEASKTIVAQSTPKVVSAIHVIRISGPRALAFLKAHTVLNSIEPRHVYYCRLHTCPSSQKNQNQKKSIDDVICFYFPSPHSYTGEEMVEIHCHGSLLITEEIIQTAVEFGLHVAAPGEFTQRAMFNGKLTMEQAEAVDVLIRSKHEYLKQNALKILEKRASLKFQDIRESLLTLMAYFESAIEFPEDEIEEVQAEKQKLYRTYQNKFSEIQNYFLKLIHHFDRGKKLDDGLKIVLVGPPNAGKSTLMNALLKEERVIVSEVEGTTRDYVKEQVSLNGVHAYLFDTAGVRETENEIEKAGIKKTEELILEADILLFLAEDEAGVASWSRTQEIAGDKPSLYYVTKKDKSDKLKELSLAKESGIQRVEAISVLAEEDVYSVEKSLGENIAKNYTYDQEQIALLNIRQRSLALQVSESLKKITALLEAQETEEILVEEIKALNELFAELNLDIDHEEIFDQLFSNFCIGK